jgi:hypothetical protein
LEEAEVEDMVLLLLVAAEVVPVDLELKQLNILLLVLHIL